VSPSLPERGEQPQPVVPTPENGSAAITGPTIDTAVEVARLWSAVDRMTRSTTVPLLRDHNADDITATVTAIEQQDASDKLVLHDLARYTAMTRQRATIPSLWDQSSDALTTGSEASEGRSRSVHRTPCDVDLMEIRALIRETTSHELAKRQITAKPTVPDQLRQLAAHVAGHEPDRLWWWEYRMSAWARLLGTYLQAVQTQPKPRRLRNASCPECKIRQTIIESDYGPVSVPPLLIDFKDGLIRAAECTGCGAAWFRGDELVHLARLIDTG
jgi:hypothetical protein